MIQKYLVLTANDKTVTRNAHAAKNHCTRQTESNGSSMPANRTMVEAGIRMLVTKRSARATLTINALPVFEFERSWQACGGV